MNEHRSKDNVQIENDLASIFTYKEMMSLLKQFTVNNNALKEKINKLQSEKVKSQEELDNMKQEAIKKFESLSFDDMWDEAGEQKDGSYKYVLDIFNDKTDEIFGTLFTRITPNEALLLLKELVITDSVVRKKVEKIRKERIKKLYR